MKRQNSSDDYRKSTQYKLKKLNHLFDLMPLSIYANLIVGFIITFFLWNKVNTNNLIFWISSMLLVTLIRTLTLVLFQKSTLEKKTIYYKIFIVQMILSTLVWGLSGFIIFADQNLTNMLIIVCVLGISIGGISSLSSDRKILFSFLSILMLHFIIRIFLYNQEFYNTIGILLAVCRTF